MTRTSQANITKLKVLEDLSKFTNKADLDQTLKETKSKIKANVGSKINILTKILKRNESGKTIHGRDLPTPSMTLLMKSRLLY